MLIAEPPNPGIICSRCGAVGPEEGAEYIDGFWYCPNCLDALREDGEIDE